MNTKPHVRIIKRARRDGQREEQASSDLQPAPPEPQQTTRDAVATITEWVKEFRQKKRVESVRAFKGLFSGAA